MIVTVVHYGTAADTDGCWIPAEVSDAPPGTPGFLCEVQLAATSVLRLQIALLLSFIADTPQPEQTPGIYQVMAVAQEPNAALHQISSTACFLKKISRQTLCLISSPRG